MSRFIEINNEEEIQLLTSDELPLVVSSSSNSGSKKQNKNYLKICNVEDYNQLNEAIQCAYIAEDEGHLFIQPVEINEEISGSTNNLKIKANAIFHNDEILKKSAWIKSGDIVTINNKLLVFKVSGDRIDIRVMDKEKSRLSFPPPIDDNYAQNQLGNKVTQELPDISNNREFSELSKSGKKVAEKKKILVIASLIILMILACYILLAETVTIRIDPEVNNLKLNGTLPSLKLGDKYVVLTGDYELSATKKGYQSLNELIKISSENTVFSFQMKELPGLAQFNIKPKDNNQIFINDVLLGNGLDPENNSIQYKIDKGQYQLRIVNSRYKPYEQTIKIEGKELLQKFDPVLIPDWGILKINTHPENAVIQIQSDGIEEQFTTPAIIELTAGEHELIISKEQYKNHNKKISIQAEEKIELELIELEPVDAQVELTSEPSGVIVQIDGQYYGKTPLTVKVRPLIKHEFELSLSGYHNKKEIIQFEVEESKQLNFLLQEKTGTIYISSSPGHSKLYIDGKLQKKSSGKFIINGNNTVITMKAKGYKSQTKKINASSYSKNLSFILKRSSSDNTVSHQKRKKEKANNKRNKSTYINSIGQTMIPIQAAEFTMGSLKNEIGRRSNEPEHKVKITRAYYLSEKEISNKQFKRYKSSHSSTLHKSGLSLDTGNQPVVNISWNDAAKFSNWLSKKEGLTPFYKEVNNTMVPIDLKKVINGYRLPFESEWEYAARGKNRLKYAWGATFPPKSVSGNFADESAQSIIKTIIKSYNDKQSVSAPIGSYGKNNNGFYDMGGNVSEWCQDYYVPYFNFKKIVINPVGPDNGVHKVVRDSSWKDSSITELRLSYRGYSKKAAEDIGFRVARYAQ